MLYGLLAKLHNVHLLLVHLHFSGGNTFKNDCDCLSTLLYDDISAEQTFECCNFISKFFILFLQ